MSEHNPTVAIDRQYINGDMILEVVKELRQLAAMAQAGLAEPTPCQKLVYHMLSEVVDFNTYPEGHK